MSDPSNTHNPDHKSAVGRGGHRIDASRNFWDSSGLKIDSASTDVAWGHGGAFMRLHMLNKCLNEDYSLQQQNLD